MRSCCRGLFMTASLQATISVHSAHAGSKMFRRLTEASRPALTIVIDGTPHPAHEGDSVAAAMLACGHLVTRHDAGFGRAARSVLPDGHMLRMPPHHRRRRQPAGLHDRGASGACALKRGGASATTAYERRAARALRCCGGRRGTGGTRSRDFVRARRARHRSPRRAGRRPGGQIFRAITASPLQPDTVLGQDYWAAARLFARPRQRRPLRADATVWGLLREGEVAVSRAGRAHLVAAKHVILATGAMERPFPIPGWTLPGVMSAGGAQILLKSSGLVPRGRTVLAGCGPLLWLIAWQYLNAGVRLEAVLDTAPRANSAERVRHAAGFAASPYLAKGLRLMLAVRRELSHRQHRCARGRRRRQARSGDLSHLVADAAQRIGDRYAPPASGRGAQREPLAIRRRCARLERCATLLSPAVDAYGASSVPRLAIAGDGAGIAGAQAAEARGRLAAIAVIRALRPQVQMAAEEQTARALLRRFERGRAFLDSCSGRARNSAVRAVRPWSAAARRSRPSRSPARSRSAVPAPIR